MVAIADYDLTINVSSGTAVFRSDYKSKKQLRLLVIANGRLVQYPFDNEITVPLTFGSGEYKFQLCEQVRGTKYAVRFVALQDFADDAVVPLYMQKPNSYVSYDKESPFCKRAKYCGTVNDIEAYLVGRFSYDTKKAKQKAHTAQTIPDIEECWKNRKGICYDLAALMVAMCRIVDIPAALVCGKANGKAHAWVEFADGTICDITKLITHDKTNYTYIPERYY